MITTNEREVLLELINGRIHECKALIAFMRRASGEELNNEPLAELIALREKIKYDL